jgi:hypothetical protein
MAVKYWVDEIDIMSNPDTSQLTFTYHLSVDDGAGNKYKFVVESNDTFDNAGTTDHATNMNDATGGTPSTSPITT